MTPIIAFERLFFAVFGQTSPDDINSQRHSRPEWTENLFKIVYGIYMLVSVIVLINLLIAMMSDTYQRIQVITKSVSFSFVPSNQPPTLQNTNLLQRVKKYVHEPHHRNDPYLQPVRMNPITSFELLFFAVFGQTTTDQTQVDKNPGSTNRTQPYWTEYLFKIVFGIYMLVSVVVLINLLIAMMSDTYQRIQVFEFNHF